MTTTPFPQKNPSGLQRLSRATKRLLSFYAVFAGLAASSALGQTWNGGGTNDNWTNVANWTADPNNTSLKTFGGSTRLTPNNDFAADSQFNGITFASGAGEFVLGGNSITLGGNITNSSSNTQTINMNLVLNANRAVASSSAPVTINGIISETTAGTNFNINQSLQLVTLGGTNTFSGTVQVSGVGTHLRFGNNNALQFAVLNHTTNGAVSFANLPSKEFFVASKIGGVATNLQDVDGNPITLVLQGGGTYVGSNTFSGTGGLRIEGGGLHSYTTAGSWTGSTVINNGTLRVAGGATVLPTTSALTINTGGTYEEYRNSVVATQNRTFSNLSGTGGSITAKVDAPGSLGTFGVTVNSTADTAWGGQLLRGDAGTMNFTKTGASQLTLSGSHDMNGLFRVEDGTVVLSGTNALTGAASGQVLNSGSLLNITGTTSATGNFAVQGSGTIRLSNTNALANARLEHTTAGVVQFGSGIGTFNIGGKIGGVQTTLEDISSNAVTLVLQGSGSYAGAATYGGSGSLVVNAGTHLYTSATGSWTGGTTINAGTLVSSQNQILPANSALTMNGGTFEMTTSTASNTINTDLGSLSGTGGLITYTVTGPGSFNTSSFNVNQSTNTTFDGVINQGAASQINFTKTGDGTLTLTGNNIWSGTTVVSAGTLIINGDHSGSTNSVVIQTGGTLGGNGIIGGNTTFSSTATLSPGNSTGVLTFNQNLTLNTGSFSNFEINGATRGSQYDGVDVGGALAYGGTLTLNFGTTFGVGNFTINLFDGFTSQSSNFAAINFTGDYTGSMTDSGGGIWDLVDGVNTFQFSTATGNLSLTVIPEPSTAAFLLLAGLGLLAARRRVV